MKWKRGEFRVARAEGSRILVEGWVEDSGRFGAYDTARFGDRGGWRLIHLATGWGVVETHFPTLRRAREFADLVAEGDWKFRSPKSRKIRALREIVIAARKKSFRVKA